jgi:hypothetical protein
MSEITNIPSFEKWLPAVKKANPEDYRSDEDWKYAYDFTYKDSLESPPISVPEEITQEAPKSTPYPTDMAHREMPVMIGGQMVMPSNIPSMDITKEEIKDIGRVGLNILTGLPRTFKDLANIHAKGGEVPEGTSRFFDKYVESKDGKLQLEKSPNFISQLLFGLSSVTPGKKLISDEISEKTIRGFLSFLPDEIVDTVIDERGKIRPTETGLGAVLDIGSYIVGTQVAKKLIGKGDSLKGESLRWLGASTITTQALADPEYNISNMVVEYMEEGLETGEVPDSILYPLAQFLSADPEDTMGTKRLKLVGEEVLFAGLGLGMDVATTSGRWSWRKSKELFNKPPSDLTAEQRQELLTSYLEEARGQLNQRQAADEVTPPLTEKFEPVEIEENLWNSTSPKGSNWFVDTTRRFFLSRGNMTKPLFNAFEGRETAKRQAVAEAEFLSFQLKNSLDALGNTVESKEVAEKVQKIFSEEDLSFLNEIEGAEEEIFKAKTLLVSSKYEIPKDVAAIVVTARETIDSASKKLLGTDLKAEARKSITDNMGSYLRRSYRAFEDPDFEVDPKLYNDAVTHESQTIFERSLPEDWEDLSVEELDELQKNADLAARQRIEKLLDLSEDKESIEYFDNVQRVTREILQKKKNLSPQVRKMLGEIEDPSENVLLTLSKVSQYYENSKFFNEFYKLGSQAGYVFRERDLPFDLANPASTRPEELGLVPISKTGSFLDGKKTTDDPDVFTDRYYTTPEMLEAITQRDQHFSWLSNQGWYKNFLYLKGQSQANKTIYSHVTHLRNVVGGLQFGLANGISPVQFKAWDHLKTLTGKNKDRAMQDLYQTYQRLGVINTSVRVNDFRQLLETGFESGLEKAATRTSKKADDYVVGKGIKWVGGKMENVYMGVDDFFKINGYEKELATLQKAFPDESLEVLQEEAANIIKNTFPNYDRVPPGIKAIKELPVGSFVSFPAEIMRTSAHIVRQASKEITSGNPVLRKRGLLRLGGYTASAVGWGAFADWSAGAVGLTEDQAEQARIIIETPWSKDSNVAWSKIGEDLYYADTQFLDSYSTMKEPISAVHREIRSGQLQGEELDAYLLNALAESSKLVVAPYTDQAMITDLFTEIGAAALSESGRGLSGRAYFTDGMDKYDKAWAVMAKTLDAVAPGTLVSFIDLIQVANEVPNKTTGKVKDLSLEFQTNATGIRYNRFSPDDLITFAAKDFLRNERQDIDIRPDYTTTTEELLTKQYNVEKARFENARKLHRKINAYKSINLGLGPDKEKLRDADQSVYLLLREAGLPKEQYALITNNRFVATKTSQNLISNIIKKMPKEERDKGVIGKLIRQMSQLNLTPLNEPFPEPMTFEGYEKREGKYKGSVVHDVPTVPENPLLRVNKETGNTYAEDAGIDTREPKANGGKLFGALSRSKYNRGRAVKKFLEEGEEFVENVKDTFSGLLGGFQTKFDEVGEAGVSIKPAAPKHLDATSKNVSEMDVGVVKGEGLDPAKSAQEGGEYVDYKLKRVLTGRVFQDGQINAFISPRPQFKAKIKEDKISEEDMKEIQEIVNQKPDKDVAFLRTNLLDSTKYKILSSKIKGLKGHTDRYGISAVQATDFKTMKSTKKQYKKDKGMKSDHIYGLHVDVKGDGALLRHLKSAPKSKYGFAQPSLRPHFVGDIQPGKRIGTIKVNANNHPLYDVIRIDAEDLSRPSNVKEPLTNESIIGDVNTYFDDVMDMKNVKSYDELEEQAAIMKTTEGGTLADLTRTIASESKNESYKIIAKKVTDKIEDFEKGGFNFTYRIVNKDPNDPTKYDKPVPNYIHQTIPEAQGGTNFDFETNTQNVFINNTEELDYPTNGLNFTTGLHESVHSVLAVVAHAGENAPATSKLNKDFVRLQTLRNTIVTEFNKRTDSGTALTPFETRIYNKESNALENVHEIVAWGLTDKNMQEFLESIPYKGNKTMWDSFVETMRKVLGLKANQDTALSELLSVSSSLFETKPSTVMERLGKNTGGVLTSGTPVIEMDARLLFNHGGYHATAQEEIDAAGRQEANQARRVVGVGAKRRGSLTGMPQGYQLQPELASMTMQTVDEAVNKAHAIVDALPEGAKKIVAEDAQRQIEKGTREAEEAEAKRTGKLKTFVTGTVGKAAKKAIASNPYIEGIHNIRAQDTLKGKIKAGAKIAINQVPYVTATGEILSNVKEADTARGRTAALAQGIMNKIPEITLGRRKVKVLNFLKKKVQERRENRN